MANRLETFERLVNTYRQEIGTIDVTISTTKSDIAALEETLANTRAKLAKDQRERDAMVEQLRGVRSVVTDMKIAALHAINEAEDATVDHWRDNF